MGNNMKKENSNNNNNNNNQETLKIKQEFDILKDFTKEQLISTTKKFQKL